MCNNDKFKKAAEAIINADALLITAGAGIGVDSGLPDFRGNSGFWKAYPAVADLGISFREMANPKWFKNDPNLAWAFYGHRLNLYRETVPHKGFDLLLNWAQTKELAYFVFTSNVDGQFQKAGFHQDAIYEVHGSIHHLQCTEPCSHNIWSADDMHINVNMDAFLAEDPLPYCPNCTALARPNILMFNDFYWLSDRSSAQGNRYHKWLNNLRKENARLVIIESGAGHAIPTVRYESEHAFRTSKAQLIRINPTDSEVPYGAISLPMGTKEAVEAIDSFM